MAKSTTIPLPETWPKHIKSAVLHTLSLASVVFTSACGKMALKRNKFARLQVELKQAKSEISLLNEELTIKDARWRRLSPHRRPYYRPYQRLGILQLKAARGWSTEQTAKAFLLNEETVSSWLRRVDEQGEKALIQLQEPVNKFPDFVRYIVGQLKVFFPRMGKIRIAQILARAGLHLSATTVRRIWTRDTPDENEEIQAQEIAVLKPRVIIAKYPRHTYNIDLTVVPTRAGFWVPWLPFSWTQVWPFCWWVAAVVDHFSRYVVGFAIFLKKPSSLDVQTFLGRVIKKTGRRPKYIISDKDSIFFCPGFKEWCRRRNIWPRYGAIKKYGSISVIERFFKSLKKEGTRCFLVPLWIEKMRKEILLYTFWHNEHRPHQFLKGKTPKEVYEGLFPANAKPRFEPRQKWPPGSKCAAPQAMIKGRAGTRLVLIVGLLEGRRHLPIIELKEAA